MLDDFEGRGSYPALTSGETILWRGKPKRGAFIATKSLSMLSIAVIWLILDLNFLSNAFMGGQMLGFLIPFFALHLMPVWIWLANTVTASRRWKNTNYYVTNRRIILQGGFLAVNETSLFYKDLRNAHMKIGLLDKKVAGAIVTACDEIIGGKLRDEFIVDPIQGGAGTSLNMNANEVIANRAIELLGGEKGDYSLVNPNDHVNCGQSTNDVVPTAGKIATLVLLQDL